MMKKGITNCIFITIIITITIIIIIAIYDCQSPVTCHYRECNTRETKKDKEIVNRFHGKRCYSSYPLDNVRFLSLIYP